MVETQIPGNQRPEEPPWGEPSVSLSVFLLDDVRLCSPFQTPNTRNVLVCGLLPGIPQCPHEQPGFGFVHHLRTRHRFFWGLRTPPRQARAPAKCRTLQIALGQED